MPTLPGWLKFFSYILWLQPVMIVVSVVLFTCTMLTNITYAPLNGFLSQKIEVVVRGTDEFYLQLGRYGGNGATDLGPADSEIGSIHTVLCRTIYSIFNVGVEPDNHAGVDTFQHVDNVSPIHSIPIRQLQIMLELYALLASTRYVTA